MEGGKLMTDRKFIMVLGMPRGGTSLVAKMLIELGVNMGERFVNSNYYPNWEDRCFQGAIGNWGMLQPDAHRAQSVRRVREYMEKRLREVDGPVGAKFPCISNLYGAEGWMTLPIDVIYVHRPLEDVIESDLKNYTTRGKDRREKLKRAAELGRIWWAQQRFLEHYEPRVTIEHDEDNRSKVNELMYSLFPERSWAPDFADPIVERAVEDPSKWRAGA